MSRQVLPWPHKSRECQRPHIWRALLSILRSFGGLRLGWPVAFPLSSAQHRFRSPAGRLRPRQTGRVVICALFPSPKPACPAECWPAASSRSPTRRRTACARSWLAVSCFSSPACRQRVYAPLPLLMPPPCQALVKFRLAVARFRSPVLDCHTGHVRNSLLMLMFLWRFFGFAARASCVSSDILPHSWP